MAVRISAVQGKSNFAPRLRDFHDPPIQKRQKARVWLSAEQRRFLWCHLSRVRGGLAPHDVWELTMNRIVTFQVGNKNASASDNINWQSYCQ